MLCVQAPSQLGVINTPQLQYGKGIGAGARLWSGVLLVILFWIARILLRGWISVLFVRFLDVPKVEKPDEEVGFGKGLERKVKNDPTHGL